MHHDALTVAIDGAHLEVERWGRRGGRTLLFLHEGLGSVALWKGYPARLAEATGLDAVVYSRRGHGRSSRAAGPRRPDFMHHEADVVLPALCAQLGLEEVVTVGHSDGASVALLAAGRGEPRIVAQALMAAHVFVEEVSLASIREARRRAAETDLLDRLGRYHDDARHTFDLWADIWLDPAFRDWNLEDRLPGTRCPSLVVQGRQDEYGSAAQYERMAAGLGGPTDLLVLDGCGHSPQRDRPAMLTAALAAFIAGLPKS
jgi:pimeloyl-ACP methyl ester carboxylesterase